MTALAGGDYVLARDEERARRESDSMLQRITGGMALQHAWLAGELLRRAGMAASDESLADQVRRAERQLLQQADHEWQGLAREFWRLNARLRSS